MDVRAGAVSCGGRTRWRTPMHALSLSLPRSEVPGDRGRRLPLGPLAALLLLLAGAGPVSADACSDCKDPTLEDLMALSDFTLHALSPDGRRTDYYETDAGECAYRLKGEPAMSLVSSRLVLRGHGEVWNCPESSSDDVISFHTEESD